MVAPIMVTISALAAAGVGLGAMAINGGTIDPMAPSEAVGNALARRLNSTTSGDAELRALTEGLSENHQIFSRRKVCLQLCIRRIACGLPSVVTVTGSAMNA